MRASVLTNPRTLEIQDLPDPALNACDILVKPNAVGVCGSDVHIYRGHANWNFNEVGSPIPLSEHPQILGHEIAGTVVEIGTRASGISVGDRVVIDQGLNCASQGREKYCEYCASGFSHHCEHYREHGITGLPGGFADLISVPAVNAVPIQSDLPFEQAAMTEPLGCVLHSLDLMRQLGGRYQFGNGDSGVDTVVICGGGPAGQLFLQAIRKMLKFDGQIILTDPETRKLDVALEYGATPVQIGGEEPVVDAIRRLTNGRLCEVVVDACGAEPMWQDFARLIRKQGTAILYGFGRERGAGGTLDELQWRGATLVATSGASGPIDSNGRPTIYRTALEAIEDGRVSVEGLITHRYEALEELDRALGTDPNEAVYLKGVLAQQA